MAYSKKQIETIFETICNRVIEGEAVRNILKEKDLPDVTTFYRWIDADEEKSKQYARAKEVYADKMFEDMIQIADDSGIDVSVDSEGVWKVNGELVQRARLRNDTRKWALSKLNPKKYGDRSTTDVNLNIEQPLFPDID